MLFQENLINEDNQNKHGFSYHGLIHLNRSNNRKILERALKWSLDYSHDCKDRYAKDMLKTIKNKKHIFKPTLDQLLDLRKVLKTYSDVQRAAHDKSVLSKSMNKHHSHRHHHYSCHKHHNNSLKPVNLKQLILMYYAVNRMIVQQEPLHDLKYVTGKHADDYCGYLKTINFAYGRKHGFYDRGIDLYKYNNRSLLIASAVFITKRIIESIKNGTIPGSKDYRRAGAARRILEIVLSNKKLHWFKPSKEQAFVLTIGNNAISDGNIDSMNDGKNIAQAAIAGCAIEQLYMH